MPLHPTHRQAAPMTVVSDAVAAGPSGDSYGAKLECPSTHVGLMTAAATWRSGGEFLGLLRSHRNYSSSIVLQRDGGGGDEGGRVRVMADGVTPRVDYAIGAADQESMLNAMEVSIRCWVAAGCASVSTLQAGVPVHHVAPEWRGKGAKTDGNAPLEAYLKQVRAFGLPPNGVGLFSAHQMGTCRCSRRNHCNHCDYRNRCNRCNRCNRYNRCNHLTALVGWPLAVTAVTAAPL